MAHGGDPARLEDAEEALKDLSRADMGDPALRSLKVGDAASKVAVLGPIRDGLVSFQREFAANPPGGKQGAILEGRDICSVICPDADLKIFITASVEARAKRRFLQLKNQNPLLTLAAVTADIEERDHRDRNREQAPLVQVADAKLLETTEMGLAEALETAAKWVEAVL